MVGPEADIYDLRSERTDRPRSGPWKLDLAPYRKRASPQVASFWPCDGRARQAAAGWRTGCLFLWACLISSAGQALRLLYMRRRDKRMLADEIEPLWLFE